jgi:poly(hydroxyalkanoate) depolymerase family esterase
MKMAVAGAAAPAPVKPSFIRFPPECVLAACRRIHPQDPALNLLAKLLGRKRTPDAIAPRPGRDAGIDIAGTIDRALTAAGLGQQPGPGAGVRATIDHALAQAGLASPLATADGAVATPRAQPGSYAPIADRPAPATTRGEWISRSFRNDAGTLGYKLYVPAGHDPAGGAQVPLVVMLHGCTQSPDDFAAGTRMNALADAHGFLVAYPAQTAKANGSKCWNWFRGADQAHGRGEPSLIAGIARQVAARYRIDPRRVFVAGLSAGAAMAVILGRTYPGVFAAVGAHSGLPFAAAHDVASAFAAMQAGPAGMRTPPDGAIGVPTIVFHGDADHTVAVGNGDGIVRDASANTTPGTAQAGVAPGGRTYTQQVFTDAAGRPRVEYWRLHGAGHAWSGGSAQGTYTDPSGPDASAEMVRFFLQLPTAAN